MYQRALEIDQAVGTRIRYGQYLAERGEHEKALEELEKARQSGKSKEVAVLMMANVLYERGEFERLIAVLSEALEEYPRNAYLWMNRAASHASLKDYAAAAFSYEQAVELMPERGPFRGSLAHVLEKGGRLEDAEKHFRQLLTIEPDNPVVYLWLAKFLGKHHPEEKEEALRLAQRALELPERRGLPRTKIEKFISGLRSQVE